MALAYGVEIEIDLRDVFDVLMNDETLSDAWLAAAADVLGEDAVQDGEEPATGSEDFADMLQIVPGAYGRVGHAGIMPLHNPAFVLDPDILPVGASIYARIVERRLPVAA